MSNHFLITISHKRWRENGLDKKEEMFYLANLEEWYNKYEFWVESIEDDNHVHIGISSDIKRTDSVRRSIYKIIEFNDDDNENIALNIKKFDTINHLVQYVCKDGNWNSNNSDLVKEILADIDTHPPPSDSKRKNKYWNVNLIMENYMKHLDYIDTYHTWKIFKMYCEKVREHISYSQYSKLRKETVADYLDAMGYKVVYPQLTDNDIINYVVINNNNV